MDDEFDPTANIDLEKLASTVADMPADAPEVVCERCGGEVGIKYIGDESYDWCPECQWVTH